MNELPHDLAAAYALDALDADERREFEGHLADCASCREEVAALHSTLGDLGAQAAVQPPPGMREAVMARVATTPQDAPRNDGSAGGEGREGHRRRNRIIGVAAGITAIAAAMALLLAGGIIGNNDIDQVLTAEDAREITIDSEVVDSGELTFSPTRMQAVLTVDGLPPVDDDQTYQLWVIDDTSTIPAGIFTPDPDGSAVVLVESDVTGGVSLGLTVEPAGGSGSPTGEILIAQPIT